MSTFAPLRQDLFVCLRCQSRLTARSAAVSRRAFSFSRRLSHQEAAHSAVSNDGSRVSHRPLKRHQRDKKINLGVNALGEPAQIRIVRDRDEGQSKNRKSSSTGSAKASDITAEALRRSVAAEGLVQKLDEKTVAEHIDDVKAVYFLATRKDPELSDTQCISLARQLYEGFTTQQLSTYWNRHMKAESSYEDLERYFENDSIQRSRYITGVSNFPQSASVRVSKHKGPHMLDATRIAGPSAGEDQSQPQKRNIVEKILRILWKVRPKSEKQCGELDVQIAPHILGVLLRHHQSIFESRSLHFNVKISISQEHNLIRLSGEYDLVSDVFKLIYQSICSVKQQNIVRNELSSRTPGPVNSCLEEIGKLANTHITRIGHTLTISYLGPDNTEFTDTTRLIAQIFETRPPAKFQTLISASKSKMSLTEVPIEPTITLPLHERFLEWRRIRYPSAESQGSDIPKSGIPADFSELLREAEAHLLEISAEDNKHEVTTSTPASGAYLYWPSKECVNLGAKLGFVAYTKDVDQPQHRQSPSQAKRVAERASNSKLIETKSLFQSQKTLITGTPGQTQLIEALEYTQPMIREEFVVHLKSETVRGKGTSKAERKKDSLHHLRLHISIEESQDSVVLKSANLISDYRVTDLLLPGHGADIRFSSERRLTATESFDPALLDFVQESNLDIWGTGQLRTPQHLSLCIPEITRSGTPVTASEQLQGKTQSNKEMRFLFSSLEHCSYLEVEHEGHLLRYATVEAGRARGQSQGLQIGTKDDLHKSADDKDGSTVHLGQKLHDLFTYGLQLASRISH